MIGELHFVQYLTEPTYKIINERLKNYKSENNLRFELFELDIKKPVHTYIMQSILDFSEFNCNYDDFSTVLYNRYTNLFGDEVMVNFPPYDEIACDYMELYGTIEVRNVDTLFKKLLEKRCVPEQLDRNRWNEVESSHSKVKFCMTKEDKNHFSYLICMHGRMLKSRIKDKTSHKYNGVLPSALLNENIINNIIAWQLHIYGLDKNLYKPHDILTDLPCEIFEITNEFLEFAERLNLKYEVKYNPYKRIWKCIYSIPNPKHVLLTLETSVDYFKVKACLFQIDEYFSEFDNLSENITNQIKISGWDCNNCHEVCRGGISITSLGVKEKKCIGGAFIFENLTDDEWRKIMELTEREFNIRKS